jgi:ribosomal protein L34E
MKTVWIYFDTNKKVGDDQLKVFASADAADRWLKKNDPAGVAFRYEVRKAGVIEPTLERALGGKKKNVSNGDLTAIFYRKMRACSECPYTGTPISIVPAGRGSEWKVLTAPYVVRRYPRCAERVEEVEKELQKIYGLAKK